MKIRWTSLLAHLRTSYSERGEIADFIQNITFLYFDYIHYDHSHHTLLHPHIFTNA